MVYYRNIKFKVLNGTTAYPNLQLPDQIKDLIDNNELNENNEAEIYVCGGWTYIIIPASGELLKNGGAWSMDYKRLADNIEGRWKTWGISGGKLVIGIRVLFPYQTEKIIKGWLAREDQLGRASDGTSELFIFLGRLDIVIKLLEAVNQLADSGMIFNESPGEDSGNLASYREGDFEDMRFHSSANTFIPGQVRPCDLRYADIENIIVGFHLGSGSPNAGVFDMNGVINIVRNLRTRVENAGSFEQGYMNMFVGSGSRFSQILSGPTNKSISTAKNIPPLENFVKHPNNVFPFAAYGGGGAGGPGGGGPGGGGPGGGPPSGGGDGGHPG